MVVRGTEENAIWSTLTEPLSSFMTGQKSRDAEELKKQKELLKEQASKEESNRRRYRKRIQNLELEIHEVNEEATTTRKLLWAAQDKLKEQEHQIRQLENHLNEILELREKDLKHIKSLRVANSDCVENESRAREAMEVFKKCYKRAQLKLKEQEEEILVLKEHGKATSQVTDTTDMVSETALQYIQTISSDKEKRLKKMLTDTEVEVDLWKSKYKVAQKRCLNYQEQILAMEHPSEGAEHIKKQRLEIDKLRDKIKILETVKTQLSDSRNPFESFMKGAFGNGETRDEGNNDKRDDGLTKSIFDGFQNLNCAEPTNCSLPGAATS